jgi:hypothetical protein
MARGTIALGATAQEVEDKFRRDHPEFKELRSKHIDVSDLRAEWGTTMFPPDNAWVLVIEDPDPANSPLPQQDDPEGETEASFRADMVRGLEQIYGRRAA